MIYLSVKMTLPERNRGVVSVFLFMCESTSEVLGILNKTAIEKIDCFSRYRGS